MDPTAQQVLAVVQKAIDEDPRFKGLFEARNEGLRHENDWWFVPVHVSRPLPNTRRFETYSQFAELESALQEKSNLQVVLIPVISAQSA